MPGNSKQNGKPVGAGKNQVALDEADRGTFQPVFSPKNATVLGTDGNVTVDNDSGNDEDAGNAAGLLDDLIADIADSLEGYDEDAVRQALMAIDVYDDGGTPEDTSDDTALLGDVVDLGDGNDVMWGDDNQEDTTGNDIILGGDGNDQIRGDGGNDALFGEDGNDVLRGDAGNDYMAGGEGNDVIDGGEGDDIAAFAGAGGDYTIGFEVGDDYDHALIVSGPEGTDTVKNTETLSFDDGDVDVSGRVLLFDDNGEFVASHNDIQPAVDAASAGYTLLLGAHTFAESVNVDKPLTFIGSGAGNTVVEPGSGDGFTIADLSGFGTDGDVTFAGLSADNSPDGSGIRVPNSSGMDTLTVSDSSFADNLLNGVAVFGDNVANVVIEGSTFTGNGGNPTSSGDGDVLFYQYEGDATLTDVSITGDGDGENAIQFRDDDGAMGEVSLENVTISGDYANTGFAVYNYSDISDLSIDNMVITASTGWDIAVNFDGIGGTIDYSALDIDTSGSEGIVSLQGDDGDNTIIAGDIDSGNTDVDPTVGVVMDAFMRGYDGDDTFVLGSGVEVVDGGNFTGGVGDQGDGDTVDYSASDAGVTVDLGSTGPQSGGDAQNDVLLGIENVVGSDQADTVTGTAEANVIEGRAGDDTIDLGAFSGTNEDSAFDRDNAEDVVVAADTFANNGTDTVTRYSDGNNGVVRDTIDLSDAFDFSADTDTDAEREDDLLDAFQVEFNAGTGGAVITDGTNDWFELHENGSGNDTPETVQVEADGFLFEWNLGDTDWTLIGPA